jgi:hypothetical protein
MLKFYVSISLFIISLNLSKIDNQDSIQAFRSVHIEEAMKYYFADPNKEVLHSLDWAIMLQKCFFLLPLDRFP